MFFYLSSFAFFICLLSHFAFLANALYRFYVSDENRDLNGHHDDDIKRQRFQYNGDPLCSNVSNVSASMESLRSFLRNCFP